MFLVMLSLLLDTACRYNAARTHADTGTGIGIKTNSDDKRNER